MNLSEKSKKELKQIILDFAKTVGATKEEAESDYADALAGSVSLLVWDALGCDDHGLVKQNQELTKLYDNTSLLIFGLPSDQGSLAA